jgi:hypothetical protein
MSDELTLDEQFDLLMRSYQDRMLELFAALHGFRFATGQDKTDLAIAFRNKHMELDRIEEQLVGLMKVYATTELPADPAATKLMNLAARTVGWLDAPDVSAPEIAMWCRSKVHTIADLTQRAHALEWIRQAFDAAKAHKSPKYVVACLSEAKKRVDGQ